MNHLELTVIKFPIMKRLPLLVILAALGGSPAVRADVLISGSATINYNQSAWEALASGWGPTPVLTLSAFFDQGQANALNSGQILTNSQANPSYTNEIYAMNGPTVTNLSGRTTQPTTFAYIPGQLTNHTGSIGLAGIARFDVFGGLAGELLYGDYTLQFDTNRIALGGSGWYLEGNIPPAAAAFDLLNVTIVETNNTLTISGDLGVSYEYAYFYKTPGDWLADVGTFTFTGQTAPPPLAMTVVGGSATVNYDETAWNSLASGYAALFGTNPPVLTLSGFFDQAQANAMTADDFFTVTQSNASYTNEIYAVNGATVTNLAGRATQPTTFVYPFGNLTNQTGSIGLGGVARFDVSANVGGGILLYGDYTLQYDPARIALGGSGWYLKDNIPPAAAAFDLTNVVIVETNNSFTLSGHLGVSYEVANLLYYTPTDAGKIVGSFNLTAYTQAIPAISQLAIAGDNVILQGTNGAVGSRCSVLSATNLALPQSSWTTNATAIFDGNGRLSNSIPFNATEPARFFRLKQP